jgi:signal transduction histidine kinase/CheY-like chemotaxis protein
MSKINSTFFTRLSLAMASKAENIEKCKVFAEMIVQEGEARYAGFFKSGNISPDSSFAAEYSILAEYPPQNSSGLRIKINQSELIPDHQPCFYQNDDSRILKLPEFFPDEKLLHWLIPSETNSFLYILTPRGNRSMFGSVSQFFSSSDIENISLLAASISASNYKLNNDTEPIQESLTDPALDVFNRYVKAADNKFLKRILATVSHEIRNPFNLMSGYAGLLEGTELTDEQKHYLKVIRSSGESLFEVVYKALQFTNIYFRQVKIDPVSFSFSDMLFALEKLYFPMCAEKGIKLKCESDLERTDRFIADKSMIQFILSYLLSNALKFSEKGEIILKVKTLEIKNNHFVLQFSISDNGKGFDIQKFKSMLQFFGQEDSSITRNYGGLGLGLSIANYYTEMLGGKITAESKTGKGSTFYLTLELDRDHREIPDFLFNPLNLEPELTKKIKVLLVDDDPFQRKMGKEYLNDFNITLAENGQQAIDIMASEKFDIVLMDIRMPVMDGITTTILIREKYGNDQKIVALSGEAIKESIDEALRAGMDGFISKPYDKEKLIFNIFSALDINIEKLKQTDDATEGLTGLMICDELLNPVVQKASGIAKLQISNNLHDTRQLISDTRFDYIIQQCGPAPSDIRIAADELRKQQPDAALIILSDVSHVDSSEFLKKRGLDGIVLKESLLNGEFLKEIKEVIIRKKLHVTDYESNNDNVYDLSGIKKFIGSDSSAMKEVIDTYLWFMPDYIKQLKDFNITGDEKKLSNVAHSIKSIVKQFKIDSIVNEIQMLEKHALHGLDHETIRKMIDEVSMVLELSIIQLKKDFG